jgi:L-amino acid N-acyltransferase YncA
MPLLRSARAEDAHVVTEIYNSGIAEGGATFETARRRVADLARRLEDLDRHPLLVAEDATGRVIGWAGVSAYKPRACYAGIGEFSVYVAPDSRGRGVGRALVAGLVDAARDAGYWKLLSRVFTFNAASRAACRAAGFREVGVYEGHGFLDGQWRDVVIVERLIPDNQTPSGLRFRRAHRDDWPAIERLMRDAALPVEGAREALGNFTLALRGEEVVGCATFENGEPVAAVPPAVLLRSVVLSPSERGAGAGRLLVERTLERARRAGIESVVLLTTTAETFFAHLGFVRMARAEVPAALLTSAEFTGACPDSAVIMARQEDIGSHFAEPAK